MTVFALFAVNCGQALLATLKLWKNSWFRWKHAPIT